jgi:hypothetical protein
MHTKILSAVWTAVLVWTAVPTQPIHDVPYSQRDDWAHETTEVVAVDPWADAVTLTGYATTYDAFYWRNHQSWFSLDEFGKPGKNAWIFASKADCAKNPEWKCYTRMVGPYKKLVRPWSSTLNNLYVALGPVLRDRIAKQMSRWHTIPTHKLRFTSLQTGISVEVWIADSCSCDGYVVVDNTKIHPLVDASPEAWAAVGREEYYVNGQRYYRDATTGGKWYSNWITVEYLP